MRAAYSCVGHVHPRERNDAVSKLGDGMRELERLEAERSDMISRIDLLSRDQDSRWVLLPQGPGLLVRALFQGPGFQVRASLPGPGR